MLSALAIESHAQQKYHSKVTEQAYLPHGDANGIHTLKPLLLQRVRPLCLRLLIIRLLCNGELLAQHKYHSAVLEQGSLLPGKRA